MDVVYTRSAEKEILSLEKSLGQRIFKRVSLLENSPFGLGSVRLRSGEGHRIRIGDYRVIYQIDQKNKLIKIIRIAHPERCL